jgi:hypothetical protein
MIEPQLDISTIKAVRIIRYISIGLFLLSLTQSCFSIEDGGSGSPGIVALLVGAVFFFTSPAAFVWFANPLLLLAWVYLFSKPKVSLVTSVLAFLVSSSFMCFKSIRTDEGGFLHPIVRYEFGYVLWVASSLIVVFANIYRKWLVNIS